MDIDSEAMLIHPIYIRYEKKISTLLPLLTRISIFIILVIYGILFIQAMDNIRPPVWEQWAIMGAFVIAGVLLFISAVTAEYFARTKSSEILMRDQFALDRAYRKELLPHNIKARRHFLKYIEHIWAVQETTDKAWAAISVSIGGLASLVPEWIGKSKGSFSFLISRSSKSSHEFWHGPG